MEDTLRQIEALQPDSLTVHALAIKRAAKYGQERNRTTRPVGRDDENMIDAGGKVMRERWGWCLTICTGRRIWREILKMSDMQRLTKREYTIYLLWKKSSPSLRRERVLPRRSSSLRSL